MAEKSPLRKLLDQVQTLSDGMTEEVFACFRADASHQERQPIYNLFAEAFLDCKAVALLLTNHVWSQAAALLRTAIERISALVVLSKHPETIAPYLEFFALRCQREEQGHRRFDNAFLSSHPEAEDVVFYLDYGWLGSLAQGKFTRAAMVHAAGLDHLNNDIREALNPFVHATLSIFDFHDEEQGWGPLARYGRRLAGICCQLFGCLCVSYRDFIGPEAFSKGKIGPSFASFSKAYHEVLGSAKS